MVAPPIQLLTLEERLVYWTIVGTWAFWLLGALYLVGPALGYGLVALWLARFIGVAEPGPAHGARLPPGVLLWIVGMGLMAVALVVGHLDYGLGMAQLVKSIFGWIKGWALMAVFPFVGAMLAVRPVVIVRATTLLALQSLLLVPLFIVSGLLSLPDTLYVSPLSMIGGPGPEFFDVSLYAIDNTNGQMRWRFFAPWSTAAATISCMSLVVILRERARLWQLGAMISALIVCYMTGSRLGLIAIPSVVIACFVLSRLTRPETFIALALMATAAILMLHEITSLYNSAQDAFVAARSASSRVRATLGAIAVHRWQTEAVVFGHGIVERGPHIVEYMPIGSHHTWYGLLYVKGAVGFLALAVPTAWSFLEMLAKAQCDQLARIGLGIVLSLVLFSFGDNLEILTYLIWPALLLLGSAMQRPFRNPLLQPSSDILTRLEVHLRRAFGWQESADDGIAAAGMSRTARAS